MRFSDRKPTSFASRRRPRGRDEGNTHVLEAVIIATIMISAVAYVATFDVPPAPAGSARELLQQKTDDALNILYDTPMSSTKGNNALSVFLLECMQGDCTNLTTRMDNLLPEGAEYAIYVSNGVRTFPVYVTRQPGGEAVTSQHLFEPTWSHTFISAGMNYVTPSDDPLLVYSLPIFNSNPITQGGSPLLVRVNGERMEDNADYILTAFGTTLASNATDPSVGAVSLYFTNATGGAVAYQNLASTIAANDGNVTLTLQLNETANIPVPAGVELTVQLPRGWTASANNATNANVWVTLENATDKSASYVGSQVRARLLQDVSNKAVNFTFNATFHGDDLDHYAFRAHLSRGAQSVAEMLVRARTNGKLDLAAPAVHLTAPRPMGSGPGTTWTLAVYAPANATVPGSNTMSDAVEVKSIEIIEQSGAPIFGNATGATGPGTWDARGDRIVWEGSYTLTKNDVLNLTFLVNASGFPGAVGANSAISVPVAFDSWTGRLLSQTAPGMFRGTILPENGTYGGYNRDSGGLKKEHPLVGDATFRSTAMPGQSSYFTTASSELADALYGSYVGVETRRVPVGGEVMLTANVQSVLFKLAEVGQQAGVTLRFYPPWSGDERIPIYEQSNLDQGLLTGDITQMIVLDLNGDGMPDPVVGTANGRVLALHGLTGDRLPGDSWTAPLTDEAKQLKLASRITALSTIDLYGNKYIVVGTDENSGGVYVLNKTLKQVWNSGTIIQGKVVSLDTGIPIDPFDNVPDIVIGSENNDDGYLYVLRALQGNPSMVPYSPKGLANVFYVAPGTPQALRALPSIGPWGTTAGVVATVQTLADGGASLHVNQSNPKNTTTSQTSPSTPRAGLIAINATGDMTSTMFGTPITIAYPYDYNGDAITDIVAAGPAGYVVMLNGTALTQPLYSYLLTNDQQVIDADVRSSVEAYYLTQTGTIAYTDDVWRTVYSATPEVRVLANAIDSNATNSIWAVGDANGLWRSVPNPLLATLDNSNYLSSIRMANVVPINATKDTVLFNFAEPSRTTDFTDVWFEGDAGWVVGEECASCGEMVLMRTTNGGHSWTLASHVSTTLMGLNGTVVHDAPTKIKFYGGVGWITGENGLLLRSLDGITWNAIQTNTSATLNDISCLPTNPDVCKVVGDAATLLNLTAATTATPQVTHAGFAVAGTSVGPLGLKIEKSFFSIGLVDEQRAYIGSNRTIFATFDGAQSWTTMPLNYLEHDAFSVNVNPDGTGYIFGGSLSNGRIWLLHDYATQSMAQTLSYASSIPAGITGVSLTHSNVTLGGSTVKVEVATNGENWVSMGELRGPGISDPLKWLLDGRDHGLDDAVFSPLSTGRDLRMRLFMNTSGDRTIETPIIREMTFTVDYVGGSKEIKVDMTNTAEMDAANTTAAWDTQLGAIRMPYIREAWVRNVSGEVHDMQIGHDINADGKPEIWIATGDVLAANSPDYAAYAGGLENKVMHPDNRVYILDGANGTILRASEKLEGEVTHLRLADGDGIGGTDILFATTYTPENGTVLRQGRLYAFDPVTLAEVWNVSISREEPTDLEVGRLSTGYATAVLATENPDVNSAGHVSARNATSGAAAWRTMPEMMGSYYITKDIPDNWLFGPYVVEVEVEWEDVLTNGTASDTVLRSARFYDYFMVTPHDSLMPASPIYNVHVVAWFPDWG